MKFVAFDPGNTTGFAVFENNKVLNVGAQDHLTLYQTLVLLSSQSLEYAICENFRIRPPKRAKAGHMIQMHAWGEMRVIRVIGVIEYWCWQNNIVFITQEPTIKPIGYKLAGLIYIKGKPEQHIPDAVAHGRYWWEDKGQHLIKER